MKTIFNIILISLFVIQTLATPNPDNKNFDLCSLKAKYGSLAPSDKDSTLAPSVQLLKMMLNALQDISRTYITQAKVISDDLLKDTNLKQNNSPEVKEFLEKIKEFEQKYGECNDMNGLFQLVVLYSTSTSDYYEKEVKNLLKQEEKEILDILKSHKTHELDDEFEKTFLNFSTKFAHKIEEVKEDLKKEEKGDKILKWWEGVKALKTYDEKMEAYAKFANLFEFN